MPHNFSFITNNDLFVTKIYKKLGGLLANPPNCIFSVFYYAILSIATPSIESSSEPNSALKNPSIEIPETK